jgi:DNA repair exonuclease SbcCD ATPase subunit
MRLVKVSVNAFQCIEDAEVELGPGLNVLYGPNDLGKSSLASAIRAVLLLPHGSSAHEQLVSWHTGEPPRVALTFCTDEQRYWRVRKSFGSGSAGSSTLEFSKDGASFATDLTGRAVDEKLRELLRWGISKPGGRGGPKGLPESFLTNVLLAEQVDVPKILAQGLTADADESGREQLNSALQALAQDPLFKRILDEAHVHIRRAYTSTGLRSKKKDSPFREVTEEINTLRRERDDLQTRLNETQSVEENLKGLHIEIDALTAELSDVREKLDEARKDRDQTVARAAVETELQTARVALGAINAALAEVERVSKSVEAFEAELTGAEQALEEKAAAEKNASLALDQAKDRLQQVTSEKGAQARELQRQQMENELLIKREGRSELAAKVEAAAAAERQAKEADSAQAELDGVRKALAEAEEALASHAEASTAARGILNQLGLLEAFGRLEEARRDLKRAQEAASSATSHREKAKELRSEAEQLEKQLADSEVPAGEVVKALSTLAQEVEVAEARLGGGLSIALKPRRDVRVQVAVDGAEPEERSGTEPATVEAQRTVELQIEDLIDVTITAGEAAARTEVERLRKRWSTEAIPVLEKAGVANVKALETVRTNADGLARQASDRLAEAQALEEKASEQDEAAVQLDVLRQRASERERRLADQDQDDLARQLKELGDFWESELDRRQAAAESEVTELNRQLAERRLQVTELKTRLTEKDAAYRKMREEAEKAIAAFPAGVQTVLTQGRHDLEELDREVAGLAERIEGLASETQTEESEARRARDEAAQQLEEAVKARKDAETACTQKRQAVAKETGTLEALKRQAERLDADAAMKRVAEIVSKLAEMPAPDPPVTQEDVALAESAVKSAERAVADMQGEIQKAQGGLEQVGGAVVREQKEEIDRALQIALEREHEVEVEYDAWKLLEETLREVENTDGAHLGKVLSGPIGSRFRELTGNRYGRLQIGPHLETEGLEAAGQIRPFDALSVGTKDQLATLFRLCIAEHLQSAVVLDDHLSQSDPDKIQWFRDLLRTTGQTIQIVLLTCRPEDYLQAGEFPADDEILRDRAAGSLRAVNLSRAIRRYPG